MPFKLRVGKRKGRYDLSRDLYVIAVQVLDGHVLQCTLSTDSTGKDCMDYICQRLELQQNIFFGLRYKCTRLVYRWVELDKPLRKQLEKTAQEFKLYFGVMFHTPNANSLTDPVARYYYFLQMQTDVLDGRLLVSPEKAISLASYSLQIDFGDYDEAKPTVATLRGKPLLPRHMTQSSQVLEDLIKQVLVGYNGLRGLTRAQAELLYITEAQQCDGYGVEYFTGRDEDGCEVFVGYCMEGVIVKRLQGPPVKYKWEEIVSILATRRTFIVNCAELAQAHFQMEDVDTAKYAAYVSGLHLQFFRNFCKLEDESSANLSTAAAMNTGANLLTLEDQVYPLCSTAMSCAGPIDLLQLQQQQLFLANVMLNPRANGFPGAVYLPNQSCMEGANCGDCGAAVHSPFSYSTSSVDRLPAGPVLRMDRPPLACPAAPSLSSLGSVAGVGPLPHGALQHRLSWMSQQLLPPCSDSSLSLNRAAMSALNGSVPQMHGVAEGQARLCNGPGRPLSLDEFNLNEMLRTAYELRVHRPPVNYCRQQSHRPQQSFRAPADPPVAAPHPGAQYLASLEAFLSAQGGQLPPAASKSPLARAAPSGADRGRPHCASDRTLVGAPPVPFCPLVKSQSSPDLIAKRLHSRRKRLQQPNKSVDAKTFENLSVENLDSPLVLRQRKEQTRVELLRRVSSRVGEEQRNQLAIGNGTPQRIIVGRATSSGSESEECPEEGGKNGGDTSRSTCTLPDEQQAFQRFNPKLYEQQLIMMQRQQQLHYRQQLQRERSNAGSVRRAKCGVTGAGSEWHRSEAVLNLKVPQRNDEKERRKSVGEEAAHRHCLLVNDHGGSSSEEALKAPETTADHEQAECASTKAHSACDGINELREKNGGATETSAHAATNSAPRAHLRRRRDEENGHWTGAAAKVSIDPTAIRDVDLQTEFERIPKKRVSAGSSTAQRRENQSLNRDPRVLPYEDTRVALRPTKHNPLGYINASHVQVPIGATTLKYVVTQGPLRETVLDFWRMIWESGCRVIVMLSRCVEEGEDMSFPYWPSPASGNERAKLAFGEYHLSLYNYTESRTHSTSTVVLKHAVAGQKRLLYHLQYTDWMEGVPASVDSFMSFMDQVRSVNAHVSNQIMKTGWSCSFGSTSRAGSRVNLVDGHWAVGGGSGRKRSTAKGPAAGEAPSSGDGQPAGGEPAASVLPPLVVHCGSGAGRAGVYLLTDLMIHALQHNQDLDTAGALTLVRQKRMLLVQTLAQYRFVHTCIAQYMRKSRLI